MARELSDGLCEMTFEDRLSRGEDGKPSRLTFEYEIPTPQERIKYSNSYVTRRGNQIVSTLGELRMNAGSSKIRGFKTGAFKVPGKGLISSHPDEPNYDPDWKKLVKRYASDCIEMLAIQIFEASMTRIADTAVPELAFSSPSDDEWPDSPAPGTKEEAKETNPL